MKNSSTKTQTNTNDPNTKFKTNKITVRLRMNDRNALVIGTWNLEIIFERALSRCELQRYQIVPYETRDWDQLQSAYRYPVRVWK